MVWPESVFPFFLSTYPDALSRIARMLPPETTLLTGAPREPEFLSDDPSQNPGYNSILAIDSDGEIVATYDKSHLVPFGEYLPLAPFWKLFGITQFGERWKSVTERATFAASATTWTADEPVPTTPTRLPSRQMSSGQREVWNAAPG